MMFSILIPAYNAHRYIERCLDSILSQTFHDYEVIIINDGSKDNTLTICQDYAKRDTRIKVFDQSNHGVAYVRNALLDKAQGDWIVFIDADDFISPFYLEEFKKQIQNDKDVNVVICNYATSKDDLLIPNNNYCTDIQTYFHNLLTRNHQQVTTTLWAKAFKRDLIEKYHLRFSNEFNMGEDLFFLITFIYHTKRVCFINKALYYWEIGNEESMTHSCCYSDDNIRTYQAILDFLKSKPDYDLYKKDLNEGMMGLRHAYYLSCKRSRSNANPYVFNETTYSGLTFLDKIRLFCVNHNYFNALRVINRIF